MKRIILFLIAIILISGSEIFSQDYVKIKDIISNVKADTLIENLSLLTGEKPIMLNGQSIKITSRYRGTAGNSNAEQFLLNKLKAFSSLKVSEQPFSLTGKNIIAVQTGSVNPKRQIIISSHFDSMPSGLISTGADDNGSGTIATLEAARIISKYSSNNTIVYAFFDEEEDNLNGSRYYAAEAAKNMDTIIAVINLDMIGWDKNNQSDVEIIHDTLSTSIQLAKNIKDANEKCGIGLSTTITKSLAEDADHASFWKYKYPAILLIETYGYQNPYYHKTTDKLEIINKTFFEKCTKLAIASAATYTDLNVKDGTSDIAYETIPSIFSLSQNYPNPFNPLTTIEYSIPANVKGEAGKVTLRIYDLLGREVTTLINQAQAAGNYSVQFNGSNLSSGVYLYKLEYANFLQVRKLVLLK